MKETSLARLQSTRRPPPAPHPSERELERQSERPSERRHPAGPPPRRLPPALLIAFDAVATTHLRPGRPPLRAALDPRTSHYNRVAALVGLCDRLAPGVARRWSRRLFSHHPLPLAAARPLAVAFAFGSGATLFRLQNDDPNAGALTPPGLVLKIYRRSLGRSAQGLLQYAQYLRAKYNTVRRWYAHATGDAVDVIPSTYFLLNAPLLGAPAVGMLQPYIAARMTDLLLAGDELPRLMAADPPLARQILFFCHHTLDIAAQDGRCLDFLGRDNVCILTDHAADGVTRRRLAILDFGIFDLAQKRAEAPAAYEKLLSGLERLEALLQEATRQPAADALPQAARKPG